MRLAILFHESCMVDRTGIERALRQLLRKRPPKLVLLDKDTPGGRIVWSFARKMRMEMQDVSEIWAQRTWRQRLRDFLYGTTVRETLIQSCDEGLVFWDGSRGAIEIMRQLTAAGKTVLRADPNLVVKGL